MVWSAQLGWGQGNWGSSSRVAQAAVALVRSTLTAFPQALSVLVGKVTQVLGVIVVLAPLTPKPVAAGVALVVLVTLVFIAAVTAVTDLQVLSLAPR